ncbi:recombinase family protein [Nocardia alni]|uniref:recombinase family protein n=1 Tax=Nocardia alni TaxID=2815723 RepID=UPI0034D71C32
MYSKLRLPIARDGGVADVLDEATHPSRRFDVMICESVSRVARRTFEGLSIEREVERAEVSLFAANEPITLSGSRAQRILQRRINQSVAESSTPTARQQPGPRRQIPRPSQGRIPPRRHRTPTAPAPPTSHSWTPCPI